MHPPRPYGWPGRSDVLAPKYARMTTAAAYPCPRARAFRHRAAPSIGQKPRSGMSARALQPVVRRCSGTCRRSDAARRRGASGPKDSGPLRCGSWPCSTTSVPLAAGSGTRPVARAAAPGSSGHHPGRRCRHARSAAATGGDARRARPTCSHWSSVASSSANQRPTQLSGSVCRKLLSWWQTDLAADPRLLEDVHRLQQQRLLRARSRAATAAKLRLAREGREHGIEIVQRVADLVDRQLLRLPQAALLVERIGLEEEADLVAGIEKPPSWAWRWSSVAKTVRTPSGSNPASSSSMRARSRSQAASGDEPLEHEEAVAPIVFELRCR